MSLQFIRPWVLLLLVPLIPWVIWQSRGIRVLSSFRRRLAVTIRIALIAILVVVLAEPSLQRVSEGLTVFFLLDHSESVPTEQRQFADAYIDQQVKSKDKKDQIGLVVFGKDSVIESAASPYLSLVGLQSVIDPKGTDIAGAMRLAMAAFPSDTARRMVVLTDGNQTMGDAELEARRCASNGVEVSVVPLRYVYDQETMVREVVLPARVRSDEPFDVKVLVESLYEGGGTLRLYGDGQVLAEQTVRLQKGLNAYVVTQETDVSGFHSFEAVIETSADVRPENNRGTGFVVIRGTPRVLILDGSGGTDSRHLTAALRAEGMAADVRGPNNPPASLAEFEAFDGILFVNYSASLLSNDQMLMIESAVRDFGTGLMMVGGEDSFGSGSYMGTPVERALPVSMDIKQRKVIPSGALVIVMHTCEIERGNFWAQQIAAAALEVLSPKDYMGFLRYSNIDRESWLFKLTELGDKAVQRKLLSSMPWQDIGDMPSFDTTLMMAHRALLDAPCNTKHIVILSDGDPSPPNPALARSIQNAGISISTVCIKPHTPSSLVTMKNLANLGGGQAYYVQNADELPRIFTKEAATIKRGLIVEERFNPNAGIKRMHEALLGFPRGFPDLLGYVITTPKPAADLCMITHQDDPLLATWRFGMGKTVAWTSDASPRWQQEWISWDGYVQFWSQLIRWLLPEGDNENIQVTTSIEGNSARVVVDAVNDDGQFMNGLQFSGTAVDPNISGQELKLRQTAPGRYEGAFPIEDPGSHMISLYYKDGEDEGQVTAGLAVPFSPEQSSTTSSEYHLTAIAEAGGGRLMRLQDEAFSHDLPLAKELTPLWPVLLAIALVLFFLDIAQRRIAIEIRQLRLAWAWVRATLPMPSFLRPVTVGPATEEMGTLMQAKSRALQPDTPKPAARIGDEQEGAASPEEVRESLLERLERIADEGVDDVGAAVAPTARAAPNEDTGDAVAEPLRRGPADAYTGSLLEAKRRAQDRYRSKD